LAEGVGDRRDIETPEIARDHGEFVAAQAGQQVLVA